MRETMERPAADSDERLWPVIQRLMQQKLPGNEFSVHALRSTTEEKTTTLCLSLLEEFFTEQKLDPSQLLQEPNLTENTRRVVKLWRNDVKAFLAGALEESAQTKFEMVRYMSSAELDSDDFPQGQALKLCLEERQEEWCKYTLELEPVDQVDYFSPLIQAVEADLPDLNLPQLSLWSRYVEKPATDLKTLATHFVSSLSRTVINWF